MLDVINNKDKFISDIMKMLTNGTSNDVKIVLEDGNILANKDVLCARSEYFSTMLSNGSNNNQVKFIEGETKTVDMAYCSMIIMEKIIKYFFSGNMVLNDLSFGNLLKMMNITSMMMLDDIHVNVKDYVLNLIQISPPIPLGLVDGLLLAEGFNLKTVKKAIVKNLYSNLKMLKIQNFKMLPINLVKDILLPLEEDEDEEKDLDKDKDKDEDKNEDKDEDTDEDDGEEDEDYEDEDDYVEDEDEEDEEDDEENEVDDDRLNVFVFWLSGNECSDEDKKEIKDSIDLKKSCFTADKLLTDVRQSGLFSIKEVDDRLLDIIRKKE